MWDNDIPDNHRLIQTVEVKEYESNSKQKVNIKYNGTPVTVVTPE